MPSHSWGDGFPYFDDVDKAASFIGDYCAKWGRMGGQSKEKFGSSRYYCSFGLSLHSLIFPKYCYFKHESFPQWLWTADLYFITPILKKLIGRLWTAWQEKVYSDAYLKAVEKFPHIRAEILCEADSPELIKGVCWQEKIDDTWHLHIRGKDGETIGKWWCSAAWNDIR